jgi:dolichol-phosphate mannosyltransferase
MNKITVIVPVFNNSKSIHTLFEQLESNINLLVSNEFEILFVNDGSSDHSEELVIELSKIKSNVKWISLQRNFGQVAAIQAGIDHVISDFIIVISADMQDPPSLIQQLYDAISKGANVAIAFRESRNDGFLNFLLSNIFYRIIRNYIPDMPIGGFDYVMFDKKVLKYLQQTTHRNRFFQGDILYAGFNLVFIPYVRVRDINKKPHFIFSNFSFKIQYFIDSLISVGVRPTNFFIVLGALFFLTSFFLGGYMIFNQKFYITHYNIAEYISVFLTFGMGMALLFFAVIGDYILRIVSDHKNLPVYIVKEKNF